VRALAGSARFQRAALALCQPFWRMVEGSNLGNLAVGHALARRHLTSRSTILMCGGEQRVRTPHLAVPTRFRGELPATPAVLSVIMCVGVQ
jgi:hypothetical protein